MWMSLRMTAQRMLILGLPADLGQLSKAFGAVSKAKTHFARAGSQLGLHGFLGDVQAQHRQFGSGRIRR